VILENTFQLFKGSGYLAEMDRIKDKVQINIPFTMLWDSYVDRFIELGLHPEIGLDANTFVRFTRADFETVARRLKRWSLTATLHAPFVDLSAGSPDPEIRALTRRRFEQVLGIVPIFSPKTVVCHFGYDWKRYDYFKAEWIENSLEIFSRFGERIKDADSRLMIENVYERSPDDMQMVFEHLEDQNVGFCLDTGHQAVFSRTPLVKWLDTLGPYLSQLHLHDNTGQADDHLAMGQGSIDFKTLFRSLKVLKKHPPVITLEPHREKDLWPSLAYLEKIWPW
jgi:sugar phosphate isomerase/epimerase